MSCTAHRPSLLLTKMLLVWVASSAQGQPLCFSKPHQEKTINVRVALSEKTTVMHAIFHPSELDCLKTCCSTDPKDFTCNLVIFKHGKTQGTENCYLFHCKRDEDCPLMTMNGVNTYNIFKGFEIIQAMSSTTRNTTTATMTTMHSTSIPAPITMLTPTTTNRPPTTTTTSTTTKTTPNTTTIGQKQLQPIEKPTINPHNLISHPVSSFPITNTVTTQAIFISIAQSAHPHTGHVYSGSLPPPAGRDTNTLGTVKGSLVAAVSVGLVCLICLAALVGRKATESFNHRQYTRLELNDLKYDI